MLECKKAGGFKKKKVSNLKASSFDTKQKERAQYYKRHISTAYKHR